MPSISNRASNVRLLVQTIILHPEHYLLVPSKDCNATVPLLHTPLSRGACHENTTALPTDSHPPPALWGYPRTLCSSYRGVIFLHLHLFPCWVISYRASFWFLLPILYRSPYTLSAPALCGTVAGLYRQVPSQEQWSKKKTIPKYFEDWCYIWKICFNFCKTKKSRWHLSNIWIKSAISRSLFILETKAKYRRQQATIHT